jgi:hypothetical protein
VPDADPVVEPYAINSVEADHGGSRLACVEPRTETVPRYCRRCLRGTPSYRTCADTTSFPLNRSDTCGRRSRRWSEPKAAEPASRPLAQRNRAGPPPSPFSGGGLQGVQHCQVWPICPALEVICRPDPDGHSLRVAFSRRSRRGWSAGGWWVTVVGHTPAQDRPGPRPSQTNPAGGASTDDLRERA